MKKLALIMVVLLTASAAKGDLAGYWKFDEGSGTAAADSSGQGNPGVLQAADSINYPQWVAGYAGGAVQFNATTTSAANANRVLVDITGTDLAATLGDAFTISMWVKRSEENSYRPRLITTDAYEVQIASDPNGTASDPATHDFFNSSSTNWQIDMGYGAVAQQSLGNWYHMAITYDGNYFRKYINGLVVYAQLSPATALPAATTDLVLGSMSDYNGYYIGALDEVAIWSGGYLSTLEVWNLFKGTVTPLTAQERGPEAAMTLVKERNNGDAWLDGYGWKTLWDQTFAWDISVDSGYATSWWSGQMYAPGDRNATYYNKWYVRNEADYSTVPNDVDAHGVIWVDPLWEGSDPNMAQVKIAAYITPGLVLGQQSWGFQLYRPELYNWENKDYFKTYARITSINGAGAEFRLRTYSYPDGGTPWSNPEILTYLGEVIVPLSGNDWEWQEFKYAVPKPTDGLNTTRVWFEAGIVNGGSDMVLFIDELNPISDQSITYGLTDFNHDSVVYRQDLSILAGQWLDASPVLEPRDSGLLVNGDFYDEFSLLDPVDVNAKTSGVDPTGWTFEAVAPTSGEAGVARVSQKGGMNGFFSSSVNVVTPIGGNVAAYTNEPNYVLVQTTTATAVAGHTYYAMGYITTDSTVNGVDNWAGWKDFVTLSLEVDGVEVASFERPMSRNRWRPLYGTYVATVADAGKALTMKFTYENTNVNTAWPDPGYMYLGYAYLGDTMPDAWPEKRDNLLTNGGFEDIDWMVGTALQDVYDDLVASDNWGAWFINGVPTPPGWLYEVPAGFNLENEGGLWASGFYGSPLPTPGMNDICIYASSDLILGQIVGALQSGATYYLDMACGVVIEPTEWGSYQATWPNPVPAFHIELWRIPAGVTDPATIHTGITTSQSGYVKIAESVTNAVGDIKGGGATPPPSKWQLMGTTYTATASDTNVYVRIYGTNEVTTTLGHPSFAYSDVYLSTTKRVVPGGSITYEIAPGFQYEVEGPYNCYHSSLMGLEAIEADIDGNCVVDLVDYSVLAAEWLDYAFEDIVEP